MQVYADVQLRSERSFRDKYDPLQSLDNAEFYNRFRMSKAAFLTLCEALHNDLERPTKRSNALSISEQLRIALRFYATGSFYNEIGDRNGVTKSTVCRTLHHVTQCLVLKASIFTKLPTTAQEARQIQTEFFQRHKMPNIIGAIDGTHIRIIKPAENPNQYYNRKGYPSINVQAVCDARCRFLDVVAQWPGCSHDSFIFGASALHDLCENNRLFGGMLLGDSGYVAARYMLVPNSSPREDYEHEVYYNRKHAQARVCIERCFEQLKRRFYCLHGELRVTPSFACQLAIACKLLHNFVKDAMQIDAEEDGDDENIYEMDNRHGDVHESDRVATDIRNVYARKLLIAKRARRVQGY